MIGGKRCPACDTEKPRDQFHRCASKADGLQVRCKECNRRTMRARHRATLDRSPDDTPGRCWHRRLADHPCRRKSTWRGRGASQWEACDLHRLPTDVPMNPG